MDKKQQKNKLPGYPHYPASEDIAQPRNNNGIQSLDTDPSNLPPRSADDTLADGDDEAAIVTGNDTDITDEDLRTLESSEQNMDTADGRNLIHSALDNTDDDGDLLNGEAAFDMTGKDLDVPGSEDDDANETIGEEDEENNYYSLGGDLHESQEENKGD